MPGALRRYPLKRASEARRPHTPCESTRTTIHLCPSTSIMQPQPHSQMLRQTLRGTSNRSIILPLVPQAASGSSTAHVPSRAMISATAFRYAIIVRPPCLCRQIAASHTALSVT